MDGIDFISLDSGALYDRIITELEHSLSEPLYPGDERRIFGEALTAVAAGLFESLNNAARQSLLRYAQGRTLDAMGERVDTPRLEPQPAKVMMRFSIQRPIDQNVTIPKGVRVTPDASHYFAVMQTAVIQAGTLSVDVEAQAMEGGSGYNGYRPGAIATLVDLIPYISNVQNTEESHGGDDGEPYNEEGDNGYRERIRLAPSRFSTAGPDGAYRYFALSADPNTRDVNIVSDQEAGTVNIILLMKDGGGPPESVKQRVLAAANDERVRPLCDKVLVEGPEFVEYDMELTYYVTPETEAAAIETVEGPNGAIARFIEWQDSKLGRDINPDKLRALILCPHWESERELAGAIRLDVVSPRHQVLSGRSVGRFSGNAKVKHVVVRE